MFNHFFLNEIYSQSLRSYKKYRENVYEHFLFTVIQQWHDLSYTEQRVLEQTTIQKYPQAIPLWKQLCALYNLNQDDIEEWFIDALIDSDMRDSSFLSLLLQKKELGLKEMVLEKIIIEFKNLTQYGGYSLLLQEDHELQHRILKELDLMDYIHSHRQLKHGWKNVDLSFKWDEIPTESYRYIEQWPLQNIVWNEQSIKNWISIQTQLNRQVYYGLLKLEQLHFNIVGVPWEKEYRMLRAYQELTGESVTEALESLTKVSDIKQHEEDLLL